LQPNAKERKNISMVDLKMTRYPRLMKHYYGVGPWYDIGYEEFLASVERVGLDKSEESTRLMRGEEIRLGNIVVIRAELVEVKSVKASSHKEASAKETKKPKLIPEQISLFN
jgi:NDP-sugar pyrophosphorylase family protein